MTPKNRITLLDEADAAIAKLKQAFSEANAMPHLMAATIGISGLRAQAEQQALAELQAQAAT